MEHVRLPRLDAPPLDRDDVLVDPPPAVPAKVAVSAVARLMPVVMLVAAAGMILLYFRSGTGVTRSPMFLFFPVMMLLSALGSAAYGTRDNRHSSDVEEGRRDYLRYLDELDAAATRIAAAQRESLAWTHPDPRNLWTLVGSRRMWERLPDDADFCHVRVGLATSGLSTTLVEPEMSASTHRDPVASEWLRRLLVHRSTVTRLPMTVDLTEHRWITLGAHTTARALARAIICQLAVLHGPDHVRVVAVVDQAVDTQWDWLKWLPHHQHVNAVDAVGTARMTCRRLADVDLSADDAHVVVLVDGGDVSGVDLGAASVTIVEVGGGEITEGDAVLDALTLAQASACARGLAPFVQRAGASVGGGCNLDGWAALNGIGDPAVVDLAALWRPRAASRRLRVAIGISDSGEPVELDIKEAAHGGMGPHGLCVGATGSGKSEFLRTLALGLVATHPPEVLNLVLVDFKGGATFLGFERLRHTAAVITNLSDEAHLVTRMRDALAGEMTRRQEMLRAAGNFANLGDYEAARVAGAPIPRLPALVVIVDEFSELLSQQPDFAELFVAIGRVGRSLGMHLLLASQRLDEGRLRGLESHLSYRICLKTFSASESRAVLGTPDAHELPAEPGIAFLKSASGELTRFHTAFVSGRVTPRASVRDDGFLSVPTLFTATPIELKGRDAPTTVTTSRMTVLASVLGQLSDRGAPAHRVWSPPFTVSPTLDEVLRCAPVQSAFAVPIGLVDKPFEQRRDPLTADLSGAGGNVAVVGGPRSGKSTALRTIVLALAATHSARQVQVYGLDFGGGPLSQLLALPHVGSVAGRHEPDLVRRIVAEVRALVRRREAELRSGAPDASPTDSRGQVFLVIDGWAAIRQEFDGLEESITMLAAQGLSVGVHVVLSASRWTEIRPALKDLLGTRIELRLGDPTDSEIDRTRARLLADSPPGRGIARGGFELVIALPRLDGTVSTTGLDAALLEAAGSVRARHPGLSAPPVELLPTRVAQERLVARRPQAGSGSRFVVGVGESDLRPLTIDFVEQPHLLILGESRSGKTTTLRTLCHEVIRANSPASARLVLVDYRRTSLGVVESDHLAGYAMSQASAESHIGTLTRTLESRMPPDGVTQKQLRDRSWWSGPDIFVVVDDYDLVAGTTANPLTPLIEILPHATDVGLHVVLARRSGGAARAMFDPMLGRMRELGCMGLMMSAGPEDGPMFGSVRPAPMPPGRGVVTRRGEPDQVVQIGWVDPP